MLEKKKLTAEELEKVDGGYIVNLRVCSCGVANPSFIYRCQSCGADISKIPTKQFKSCPSCHRPNAMNRTLCLYCNTQL